jgi:hypothetical protein
MLKLGWQPKKQICYSVLNRILCTNWPGDSFVSIFFFGLLNRDSFYNRAKFVLCFCFNNNTLYDYSMNRKRSAGKPLVHSHLCSSYVIGN